MSKTARFFLVYALAAAALFAALEPAPEGSVDVVAPLLPVETIVSGAGATPEFVRALASETFRWVSRSEPRIWRRGLAVDCQPAGDEAVRVAVFAGAGPLGKSRPVWNAIFRRAPGADGEATTAVVIARLLWAQPRVADAAVQAYLDNQADVARAGADLWRAKRWKAAASTLSAALESDWAPETEAQLYFGLADSYAHLGRPRQAFWYALAYLALARKEPPAEWVRGLRGVSGLLAEQPANVEPEAQDLARRQAQQQGAGALRGSFEDLKRLCQLAPWSEDYQLHVASVYDRLGWRALANAWKRRAAFTRRLAADEPLQRRLSALVR